MAATKKKPDLKSMRRSELIKIALKKKKIKASDDQTALTRDALVALLS